MSHKIAHSFAAFKFAVVVLLVHNEQVIYTSGKYYGITPVLKDPCWITGLIIQWSTVHCETSLKTTIAQTWKFQAICVRMNIKKWMSSPDAVLKYINKFRREFTAIKHSRGLSQCKKSSYQYSDPIVKIIGSHDHLIFMMEIPIPGKTVSVTKNIVTGHETLITACIGRTVRTAHLAILSHLDRQRY